MKIMIVGLLSFIVLTACVRSPGKFHREIPIQTPAVEDMEPAAIPSGLKEYCKAQNLVLVVTVNKRGKPKIKKCPGIKIEETLPDGQEYGQVDYNAHPQAALFTSRPINGQLGIQ